MGSKVTNTLPLDGERGLESPGNLGVRRVYLVQINDDLNFCVLDNLRGWRFYASSIFPQYEFHIVSMLLHPVQGMVRGGSLST